MPTPYILLSDISINCGFGDQIRRRKNGCHCEEGEARRGNLLVFSGISFRFVGKNRRRLPRRFAPRNDNVDRYCPTNCNVANSIRRAVTRDHSGYFTRVIPAQSPRLEVTPAARRAITNILPSSQEGCNRYKVAFEKNIYFTYESFSIPNG